MSAEKLTTPPRILLIEDSPDLRELVERALSLDGYKVETAEEGSSALELLKSSPPPDLVLLDISMPGMSGEEFIQTVRKVPGGTELRIVLMSGWDDIADRARDLGAAGWIRKPLDLDLFTDEVERQLKRN